RGEPDAELDVGASLPDRDAPAVDVESNPTLERRLGRHVYGEPAGEHVAQVLRRRLGGQHRARAEARPAEEPAHHLPALGDEGPVAPAALPVPQVTIVREARIIDVADALDPHSYLQPHALHLRVEVDRVAAELAPVAALLVAAEGRARIEHIVEVDPHRPRPYAARPPVRFAH